MRKLLLFLLLLAAGLFLLYWLDLRGRGAPPAGPAEPLPPALEPDGETRGFQLGGPSQFTHYDEETKLPTLRGTSEDTRSEGGVDLLTGVTLELFGRDSLGAAQVRLRAERARRKRLPSRSELEPRWEDRLELEGVQAEILSGVPMAPIAFQTTSAVIEHLTDPATREVLSEERFTARSPDLVLEGVGCRWSTGKELFSILRSGRVELLRPAALPAMLTARDDGPLQVRREPGGTEVILEASGGALLEPGGQSPGRLEADHLVLRTRGTEALSLASLEAAGNVDWTSGEAHFRGQRLSASFAPEGRLERARLDGNPRAELALELSGGVLAAAESPEQRLVVLEGQDSLDIAWKDGGYALEVESLPAAPGEPQSVPSVATRDFRLQSASAIDGWLSEDRRSARFAASGGVLVTSGEASLETAAFTLEIGPDARGETVLLGTASGGARLAGKLPPLPGEGGRGGEGPARGFTLASPDGLRIERSAMGWRVIESTRVEVSVDGPKGLRARAQRITDFVVPRADTGELAPESLRFLATGSVLVDFEAGRVGGEELQVLSVAPVPHFVMRGTRESKAFFSGSVGEASALEVERTGDTWHARGEVTGSADFRSEDRPEAVRTTFAGDELTLDLSESGELLPGERLRTLRTLVEGHVQGSVTVGDETLVVHSERLSGQYRERLLTGAEKPLEIGSLFLAEGTVHAELITKGREIALDCERIEVERTASDVETGFRQLTASGNVRFRGRFGGRKEFDVGGESEVFVLGADRRGSLEAPPHGRVALYGRAPGRQSPFRLTAERVDFELSEREVLRLLALRPELRMLGLRARAEHFTADDQLGVALSGAVRLSGATPAHVPFTLEADEVVLVGRRQTEARAPAEPSPGAPVDPAPVELEDQLDALLARGRVDFRLSDSLRARGERLAVRRSTGLLRLEGAPARFDLGATRLEVEWVEFDPFLQVLVGTGRGRLLTTEQSTAPSRSAWTLDFLSMSTLLELDSVVLVVQEPLFRTAQFQSVLRATWAILWLNRDSLQDPDRRDVLLDDLRQAFARMRSLPKGAGLVEVLALFKSAELSGLLRELYFEGPVELISEGELLARADAIYLDAASQHGWLAKATVNLGGQFVGQRHEKLVVKADWLRISSDASLRADRATVTPCSFDEPHVRVVTGDLEIRPVRGPGKEHYQLVLEDNRIELYDTLRIPLPTIDVATDEDFEPLWPTLSLANSARFGTLLSFAFTRPADRVGRAFDKLARPREEEHAVAPTPEEPLPPKPRSDVDAHYKVDGSYLGSRGGLLDLGLEIEAKDDYWFDLYVGLVLDGDEDRGFIRVDEDDRGALRRWLRSQAYFDHGHSAWSFSLSDQSDAGVQSEFFEGRFLRYERSENYVQWRRSAGENFLQGSLKLRLDDFRTDVDELPSLSAYRGRSPLLRLGQLALLHTGDVRAEYLRRRTGSEPHSPFEPPLPFDTFPDFGTLDDRGQPDVVRVDSSQTLELPLSLGAGWRLTPFVAGRATGWSEGVAESGDSDDEPTRILAEAGARLGVTFWRRARNGRLHQIAPFVEYRSELERRDEGDRPLVFDPLDRLLSGDFLRFGARSRFGAEAGTAVLDLDLVGGYGSDRSDGGPDGWLPLEVFARFLVEPLGHEFEVFHDARYDLEQRRTLYSLVSLGTHLGAKWGVQFAHQRGLGADGRPLFEAASLSGLYRWTEKWEFEARESFSLLEDEELDTRLVLRRYGHDLVLELESSVREGEGSSVGVNVKPRFGYHPPRIGYVPW